MENVFQKNNVKMIAAATVRGKPGFSLFNFTEEADRTTTNAKLFLPKNHSGAD